MTDSLLDDDAAAALHRLLNDAHRIVGCDDSGVTMEALREKLIEAFATGKTCAWASVFAALRALERSARDADPAALRRIRALLAENADLAQVYAVNSAFG